MGGGGSRAFGRGVRPSLAHTHATSSLSLITPALTSAVREYSRVSPAVVALPAACGQKEGVAIGCCDWVLRLGVAIGRRDRETETHITLSLSLYSLPLSLSLSLSPFLSLPFSLSVRRHLHPSLHRALDNSRQ